MSKFDTFLKVDEYTFLTEIIELGDYYKLNELSDTTFSAVKNVGDKLGLKIKKSDTIWNYLKKSGKEINDLVRLASIFILTDVTNTKFQKEIIRDAKKVISSTDKRELVSFFMQLDKATFGVTSHIRHILQSVFGIEVTTYSNWMEDFEYIDKELNHIVNVLKKLPMDTKKEIEATKELRDRIFKLRGDK